MAEHYGVTLNTKDKVVLAFASGFVKLEDASDLVKQFKDVAGKVNTKEYVLIVDGKDAKTVTPDVVPLLQEVTELYINTPFKAKYMVALEAGIKTNQIKRVSSDFMGSLQPVASIDEALGLARKL